MENKLKDAQDELIKWGTKIQEKKTFENETKSKTEDLKQIIMKAEQEKLDLEKRLKEKQDLLIKVQSEAEAKEQATVKRLNDLNMNFQMKTGELKGKSREKIKNIQAKFQRCSKEHPSFLYLDKKNQPLYYVEDILKYKRIKGEDCYEVKWFGARNNTWESVKNLENISEELLEKVRKESTLSFVEDKTKKKIKK